MTRAQQPALPVIGLVMNGSADPFAGSVAAFHKGLRETGYVEGHNVTVEYHSLEHQSNALPALMADLVRRRVAAKAATTNIPIVFGAGDAPVKSRTRWAGLPDIPTVGEFVSGYEVSAWYGVGAPKNTPAVIDKLNKEIDAALADPNMKARLAVQRIISRIEIKDDLPRRPRVCLHKQVDQSRLMATGL